MKSTNMQPKNGSSLITPLAAGIAGAAIGAVAVSLAHKSDRQKIGKFIQKASDKGKELSKKTAKNVKIANNEITKTKKTVEQMMGKKLSS